MRSVCAAESDWEKSKRAQRRLKKGAARLHVVIGGRRQNGRYGGEEVTGSEGLKVNETERGRAK